MKKALIAGVVIAIIAVTLWAALHESDEERVRYTWQVRLTVDGLDGSAMSLDLRDTDQELEQELQQLLKPAFELPPPRKTGEIGTISFRRTITQHVGTDGWEEIKNRIKSNLGIDYREASATFTQTTSFEEYLMPNPRGGGITTGFRTSNGELVSNPDFPPEVSSENRLEFATMRLVERLRDIQRVNEPFMDDDFCEDMKQQVEKSLPSGSPAPSAPAPVN
ncbi:MAG: hypothetical protein ACOCXY_00450 [Planctomycetota bacterium]